MIWIRCAAERAEDLIFFLSGRAWKAAMTPQPPFSAYQRAKQSTPEGDMSPTLPRTTIDCLHTLSYAAIHFSCRNSVVLQRWNGSTPGGIQDATWPQRPPQDLHARPGTSVIVVPLPKQTIVSLSIFRISSPVRDSEMLRSGLFQCMPSTSSQDWLDIAVHLLRSWQEYGPVRHHRLRACWPVL